MDPDEIIATWHVKVTARLPAPEEGDSEPHVPEAPTIAQLEEALGRELSSAFPGITFTAHDGERTDK